MEANASHIRGSTRSLCTPLSRSTSRLRRFVTVRKNCVQNAYKMRPNFKMQILICSLPTTYNFTALKCTHFPDCRTSPLPSGEGQGEGQTGTLVPSRPCKEIHTSVQSVSLCPIPPIIPISSITANQRPPLYKTRQNETICRNKKSGSLRPRHLRRRATRSSHFEL